MVTQHLLSVSWYHSQQSVQFEKKKLITMIYVQVQDNADTVMSTVCVITWQHTEDLMNIRQFN